MTRKKATEDDLGTLHGEIAAGLTDVIRNGEIIDFKEDGTPLRKSASAAFFMAGITLLKNNNITADASKNAELDALSKALADKRKARKTSLGTMQDAVLAAGEALDHALGQDFGGH